VIVTDSRNAAKRGLNVDLLGSYDPKAGKFQIDGEKAKHWISKGVQVSDTVYNFLVSQKIVEGKKRNALSRKTPIVDEAKIKAEADAKAAAEKAEADAKAAAEQASADAKAAEEAAAQAPAEVPVEEAPVAAAEEVAEEKVAA
jgi:small subunit ribosomal protein S16